MDLLSGNIKKVYLKYLAAAFGSALITSIYGVVDMAMVGQYHGPSGSAAMAVIAPIWNILYSFGLLTGIGGSVLFSNLRGKGSTDTEDQEYFTTAVLLTIAFAAVLWISLIAWEEPLLRLFGANDALLSLSKRYLVPVKFAVPVFLFTQLLAAFLRNDSDPGLATKAVLCGGVINVVGDYLLVFVLDLGIMGAGIATVGSAALSLLVMSTHFLKKTNTLRWVWPGHFFVKAAHILTTGFSTFFIDIAMGILTMLFNRQIMRYAGTDALAVYGIIVNISTFVQCCAYGIGQASQPILSTNYGAQKWNRIRRLVRYNMVTVLVVSVVWFGLVVSMPNGFVRLFMTPTESVLTIAPSILRIYALSFLLLPLNIYSTYFFQSVMKPGISFLVSIVRGMVVSGALILILPAVFGGALLWYAMPITELFVAVFVILYMRKTLLAPVGSN
ncbi:MATE family efflux transporter [Butyricicoccus sp. Marseille-Q5471]|uniref:MATE family efflux transporter n=1 Tax=Butyricicoccus sp. Marseille-Q5471 TaxID=3039493 RepID=UPI0024BBF269|nr:MATE family efflux transporter [Butyricicoccus sp. Marseille-Q5471]